MGYVEFPDGFQFSLFRYEENMETDYNQKWGVRTLDTEPYWYRAPLPLVQRVVQAILRYRFQFEDEYKEVTKKLDGAQFTFDEYALVKAWQMLETAYLLIQETPLEHDYLVDDTDGYAFRLHEEERFSLEVIGFDFEFFSLMNQAQAVSVLERFSIYTI